MDIVKALMEGITQDLIIFIIQDNNITIEEAMKLIYGSAIFEKLMDHKTGLYRESSAYVYELLRDELCEGKIVQKEI